MEHTTFESTEERTFQYQNSLPPLPVPSLDESFKKYLDAVKPFLNKEEYRRTFEIVKKFEHGIGKELQHKLLERAKVKKNWLEEWWLNSAYLDVRMPTQLNFNVGGPTPFLEHYWPPKEGTQVERGAIAVWHIFNFWNLLRRERYIVDKVGETPLDMNQFRMLFSTCKVPGITRDSITSYFRTEREGDCPSHVVVMCRGRIFTFNAVHDGHILTPPEIHRQLAYIQKRCHTESNGPGVSALTTEERTRWAKIREYLINLDPKNVSVLETIQRSLFVISLDDASPEDYCMHSPFDGIVLIGMNEYVDWKVMENEGLWKGSHKIRDIPWPEELVFTVDLKVLDDIRLAKEQYQKQASDLQLINYAFTSFGKKLVKELKLHPDTLVQLALQLAYYKLHRRPGCCYETATTRMFYHGRTETMRSCTIEAVEWCQAMLDPAVTPHKRQQLMLKAFERHNKLMSENQNGKGFDRHLLGLQILAKEQGLPVPELYTDPAFTRSGGGGNFVLSTSLLGYTNVQGAAVPMVHNGYGVFYRIRNDRIVVVCTAWKSCPETDAEKLLQTVFQNFYAMAQLMGRAQL
ncbi:peroxisomal carnitine O-octanoyltransferase isoform X2 [Microcaecilia unicolor]|uniref:Peroxisomal carnitine O-octanoyltransferase n=1 Tax=Microcaecilia unicolor TaxID=1415580 RepID=A0A6P7XRG4_9AMPH|nr:peroxisomal carnitine O-octanoyltransferase isoform X2 [Microcaecilia unicolor]